MSAQVAVRPPALPVAAWVATDHLVDLIDTWAVQGFQKGTYDPRKHANLADLALTVEELDQVIAPLLGDVAGQLALKSLQKRRAALVEDVFDLLGGQS